MKKTYEGRFSFSSGNVFDKGTALINTLKDHDWWCGLRKVLGERCAFTNKRIDHDAVILNLHSYITRLTVDFSKTIDQDTLGAHCVVQWVT